MVRSVANAKPIEGIGDPRPRRRYWAWKTQGEMPEDTLPPVDVVQKSIDRGFGTRAVGHYVRRQSGRGPRADRSRASRWSALIVRLRTRANQTRREMADFVALCRKKPFLAWQYFKGDMVALLTVMILMLLLHRERFIFGSDDLSILSQFTVLGTLSVLLIVIWYGVRPAVLESFLLFAAYEFLFETHYRHITVILLLLCPFLAIAGAFGYYASRERASLRELSREKDNLRRLNQSTRGIVEAPRTEEVLSHLCEHLLTVLEPARVQAVALLAEDERARPVTLHMKPEAPPSRESIDGVLMGTRALAEVRYAWHHRVVTALTTDSSAGRTPCSPATFYIPLSIGGKHEDQEKVVGVLALVGVWDTALLAHLLGAAGTRDEELELLGVELRSDLDLNLACTLCHHLASVMYRRYLEQQTVRASIENDSVRMKESFLVFIAHELRTPVQEMIKVIDDYRAAVSGATFVEGRGKEVVTTLRRNAKELERLIDNAFALVELEEGRYELQTGLHRPDTLVREIVSSLSSGNRKRIQFEFAPELPFVRADPKLIETLLRNLIENAFRHSQNSPVVISARVNYDANGDGASTVHLAVADQGCGIREDDLEHIFQKWVTLDYAPPAGRKRKGYGLGLPICRIIASLHGGRVHAESEFGRGATFIVTLPVPPQPPPDALPEF